jgi:hypothetical protein
VSCQCRSDRHYVVGDGNRQDDRPAPYWMASFRYPRRPRADPLAIHSLWHPRRRLAGAAFFGFSDIPRPIDKRPITGQNGTAQSFPTSQTAQGRRFR